jgi:hypothetical protein
MRRAFWAALHTDHSTVPLKKWQDLPWSGFRLWIRASWRATWICTIFCRLMPWQNVDKYGHYMDCVANCSWLYQVNSHDLSHTYTSFGILLKADRLVARFALPVILMWLCIAELSWCSSMHRRTVRIATIFKCAFTIVLLKIICMLVGHDMCSAAPH